MYKRELILDVYKRAEKYHEDKRKEWKPYITQLSSNTRIIYNHFYEVVQQYAIALIELDFTPSLSTMEVDSLEQIKIAKKLTDSIKLLLSRYSKDIQTFLQNGIAINYSALQLFLIDDEVRLKYISHDNMMIYRLPDQTFFVIEKKEKKLWTNKYVYTIKDKSTVTIEENYLGFIPFLIFQPYRINKGEENALGYYGKPNWQLMNLQKRYNNNQTLYGEYTQSILKPPILSRMTAQELTPEEYHILIKGNGIVKTNDPINDHIFKSSVAASGLQVLQNNEQKILQEKKNSTGISEATLGGTTKDYSTSYFKALKETASRPMKEVENEYKRFYNELVMKIAKFLTLVNSEFSNAAIENLKLEVGKKELDPAYFQNFFNNFLPFLEKMGTSKATIDLVEETMTPVFYDIVSASSCDQVESLIGIKNAFNSLREDVNNQELLKDQQHLLQKEKQELDLMTIQFQKQQIQMQMNKLQLDQQ